MKIIKVMVSLDTASGYGRDFFKGVSEYAKIKGNWSISSGFDFHLASELKDWQSIWNADAVIASVFTQKKLDEVRKMQIPTVMLSALNYDLKKSLMLSDDEAIAKMAAEHFLEKGFRHFAYCGRDKYYWSINRGLYYIKYLEDKNFTINTFEPSLFKGKPIGFIQERDQIVKWLNRLPKPVGLFCCNDVRSQEVIEACRLANINVPEDIAVIGVDNDYFNCELSYITLTSIALDTFTAGFQAAELLDAKIKNKKTKDRIIPIKPTHIAIRRSTDICAIEDREIANAMCFIRDNSRKIIQVSDVVAATTLTRRVLEKRFNKILKRSILEEIKNKKTAEILKMLTQTNYSISEISKALGFDSTRHFDRYFRQTYKISPSLYQKKFIITSMQRAHDSH
jgi:LacI family transcriptional regulator